MASRGFGASRTGRSRRVTLALAVALLAGTTQPAAATWQGRGALVPAGTLHAPVGVAVDDDGNVFVVEAGNRVRKYAPTGTLLKEWGTAGSASGQFNSPSGIAVDSAGRVYVTDSGNARIQKFSNGGTHLTSWGTSGTADGQFTAPRGIAIDATDRVYVTDVGANNVQKFTATGGFMKKWGSPGSGKGEFSSPIGIAVDRAGNVYVADAGNSRIQRFSSGGAHRQSWGTSGTGKGQFTNMGGIAIDHEGALLVADRPTESPRVQRFTSQGTHLATFPVANDLGHAYALTGLAVSSNGTLYAADWGYDGVWRSRAVPPDTTVTGPSGLIRDATPTFTLTSSQSKSTFQCRLKGSGLKFTKCPASYTTPELDDGLHILLVRAIDSHGLIDPTPAEAEFRVDATPPQTWFDSTPPSATTDTTPTFAFSASERGTFQCSLDGATFATCTSPHTTASLAKGFHTFKVRAKDRAGNVDPTPASHRFEVR